MTQDEIIRMAREAGLDHYLTVRDFPKQIERFAALVAAHEREACAKVCEELINEETCYVWIPDARGAVNNCAAAIRARSETKLGWKRTRSYLGFYSL